METCDAVTGEIVKAYRAREARITDVCATLDEHAAELHGAYVTLRDSGPVDARSPFLSACHARLLAEAEARWRQATGDACLVRAMLL